jgi:site-specific DNA-methyltransferase (cytosine-N4-specific)
MLIQADARQIPLRDQCVQCVITSPPYFGLRDYGIAQQIGLEPTPEAYVQTLVAVFREVRRVLKTDGVCWLNLGDSYAREGGKTAGVPRHWDGRVSDPGGQHDKRALASAMGLKPKDLIGIPWSVALALRADGWYLRSDVIWAKPNAMPESVTDRPTKAHEYLFLLSKSERYFYGPDARRTVWTIPTMPFTGWTKPVTHFATMPEQLVEPCILAGSRLGDRVFDPFVGSGTVGTVAERLGRRWVGTDLTYQDLAKGRTAQLGLRF